MAQYARYPSFIASSNPSVGTNGLPAPTSSTEVGGINPSGDLEGVKVDANGNLLVAVDPSVPLHVIVDSSALPTGAATSSLQTSGNTLLGTIITDMISGAQITQITGTVPLPTGASTAALQTTGNTSLASIVTSTAATAASLPGSLGAKTSAASTSVVLASDQASLPVVTLDSKPATQNITVVDSASSTATGYNNQSLITGTPTVGSAASFAIASEESVSFEVSGTWTGTLQSEVSVDGGTTWVPHGVHQFGSPNFVVVFTANFIASLNMAAKTNFRLRATAAVTGTATVRIVASVNASTIYVANSIKLVDSTASANPAQATIKAASTAALTTDTALVVAVSPNNVLAINQTSSGTSAVTSVASSITSVSLLAVNNSRRMATFYNDSTAVLYLKLGATASTTSYTVQLVAGAYYELPWKAYTGAIDGIWAAANGNVRITELT